MKKSILLLVICLFASAAFADDFSVTQRQNKQAQPRKVVIQQPRGEGSVQWALRQQSPMQALNPFAPVEYGDGTAFVEMYEEYDPSQRTPANKPRGNGVKFFSFSF